MAKAWKDVIASPQYQALAPEQKAQAQAQYFDEVVAPKAGDKWAEARDQFYAAYPPHQRQKEEPSLMQQAGDWLTGGQSAGQIAEQAGRGLVNIPFDVLQGGASLINAISQGLVAPRFWMMFIVQSIDRQTLTRKPVKQLVGISCQLAQRQKLLERQQSSQETSVPQET